MKLRIFGGRLLQPPASHKIVLPLTYRAREQDEWCWAAVAEMVLYGKTSVRQCDFANYLFPGNNCCVNPSSTACNRPCTWSDVVKIYADSNIKAKLHLGTIGFSGHSGLSLEHEIQSGRPVEVGWRYSGTNRGHLVLVYGWEQDGSDSYVMVADPNPIYSYMRQIAYSDLMSARGGGNWLGTWTDLG